MFSTQQELLLANFYKLEKNLSFYSFSSKNWINRCSPLLDQDWIINWMRKWMNEKILMYVNVYKRCSSFFKFIIMVSCSVMRSLQKSKHTRWSSISSLAQLAEVLPQMSESLLCLKLNSQLIKWKNWNIKFVIWGTLIL